MLSKDKNLKKDNYFSLPAEDRINLEMEAKEKEERESTAEKVFNKLNEKNK
ncbi:hypothetical protein JYK21_03030 [Ralstonia pickettii]|nr:hypothetical protein [Ralstonia pickettii]